MDTSHVPLIVARCESGFWKGREERRNEAQRSDGDGRMHKDSAVWGFEDVRGGVWGGWATTQGLKARTSWCAGKLPAEEGSKGHRRGGCLSARL